MVLARRNQCEQWAAANECVTNAKYSCVCCLLCVLWAASASIFILRAGFSAGAKIANKRVWVINVGLRSPGQVLRASFLMVKGAIEGHDAESLEADYDAQTRPDRPVNCPRPLTSAVVTLDAETRPRRDLLARFSASD